MNIMNVLLFVTGVQIEAVILEFPI